MIDLSGFTNLAGMAVLGHLDVNDLIEAQLVRGHQADHLDLFTDWKVMQAGAVVSLILSDPKTGGRPFAVLALGNTGQAGVAQAALLSKCHVRNRRSLARAALQIRARLPIFCEEVGIFRIEARCWSDHPTAPTFLHHCGFHPEVDMPGFGPKGRDRFTQFAWTNPCTKGT
ncbi:hypothetical protein [Roseovarius atlanticus]|uniref:hypothetical protein n=1 Tax=Roseovarius atlanticus TaxID=1641875 RepID=UPI001C96B669|nr:hypothetical protein [Roseovarius atlanticus]MBY5988206.1 hypothetical protein [Roseovarius atlanticus]MBY6123597.1 hypothetical protein [Roseovarius atlanticus]MBY6148092.1 hypothetical protein [Roseovarius atlanticus]